MDASAPLKRRHFRFSLQTLLLFVLLIGFGAMLARQLWRGPWEPTEVYRAERSLHISFYGRGAWAGDVNTSLLVNMRTGKTYSDPGDRTFSDDGTRYLLHADSTIRNAQTGEVISTIKTGSWPAARFSFDCNLLAAKWRDSQQDYLSVWDTRTGALRTEIRLARDEMLPKLAISPDNRILARAEGNSVTLWSAENGAVLHRITLPEGYLWSLAFNPDPKSPRLVVSYFDTPMDSNKSITYIFDPHTGREIARFPGVASQEDSIAAGRLATAGFHLPYELRDVSSGASIAQKETSDGSAPMLSPSGKYLLSINGGLWSLPNFRELYRFPLSKELKGGTWEKASFLGDDSTVVTCHAEPKNATEFQTVLRRWTRRYPCEWWGIFWLLEFWMAVLLVLACAWSVWRDRRV